MAPLRLALVAVLLCAVSRAEARPKIPKVLEDVDLANFHGPAEDYKLVSLAIVPRIKRIAGRNVIVFTHRYTMIDAYRKTRTTETELQILSADDKVTVFRVLIDSDAESFDVSWKDYDRDGEWELVLSQQGAVAQVWQERYGEIMQVGAELAGCGRSANDDVVLGDSLTLVKRDAAVDTFVTDADYGASDRVLHCDFGDAVMASHPGNFDATYLPWPEVGAAVTLSQLAPDCPSADWAARHGSVVRPRRVGTFVTADQHLALLAIDDSGLFVTAGPAKKVIWAQPWLLDDHLYTFGETVLDGSKVHHAQVVDVVTGLVIFETSMREGETAALQIGVSKPGQFELVAAGPEGARSLWHQDTRTWQP